MSKANWIVETFVLVGGTFRPLSECKQHLPDSNYVEGKIELTIDGAQVLTEEHWDLVDQLWAYLIDGLSGLLFEGRDLECYFPDQPLRLAIGNAANDEVEFRVGDLAHHLDRVSFTAAISEGGRRFFEEMLTLVPSGAATWTAYIERCKRLARGSRE